MWFTLVAISIFILFQIFLYRRGKFFFIHSLFLIPLHATLFFIDHNAARVIPGLARDSVYPVIKLLPVYITTLLLYKCRVPSEPNRKKIFVRVINFFLLWLFTSTVISAFLLQESNPLLIASFTAPVFWVFFNSENIHTELADMKEAAPFDKNMLQLYYLGFFTVYILSLYYSVASGITSSLLDSRNAGSIFASSSAIVYCILFAPLLSQFSDKKYPYIIMILICVLSLSKTALFIVPMGTLMLYRYFNSHFKKHKIKYLFALMVIIILFMFFMQTQAYDVLAKFWSGKFALGNKQASFLEKAYSTRMKLYKIALDLIASNPMGIGMGNFELFQQWGYKDPHNFVLTVMVENGWIAGPIFLAVFFYTCFRIFVSAIRAPRISFVHFSMVTISLIYFSASGVLATTGYSDLNIVYFTPFYGVAIFFHLNVFLRAKPAQALPCDPPNHRMDE